MRTYLEKISERVSKGPLHTDSDYKLYDQAMDAICSRKPHRMSKNGFEMLLSKVTRIRAYDLRKSAEAAYRELERDHAYSEG